MSGELWHTLTQIVGASNAALLGAILIVSPRLNRTRARRKLGLALLAYAYLLYSFTAVDNGWIRPAPLIWVVDFAVALMAAALFLDYMCGALGGGELHRACYLPPLLIVIACGVLGEPFIVGPGLNVVIVAQVSYTLVTTGLYLRSGSRLAKRPRHLGLLLLGLWSIHAFQLSRMAFPQVTWLFDAVPLYGGLMMLLMTAFVLSDSRALRTLSEVKGHVPDAADEIESIQAYMLAEQPHLDPSLTLEALARAVGMTRGQLSRLIASSTGGNFYDFVNAHRVQEARRILSDPREHRTSIEAVGLMAGFKARSTFYESFRKATGTTPANYRRKGRS